MYDASTPAQVKQIIQSAVTFTQNQYSKSDVKLFNAFFSGSVKTMEDLPFFYPSNNNTFSNGTHINPNTATEADVPLDDSLTTEWIGYTSTENYNHLV